MNGYHRIGIISDTHIPQFKRLPDAIWQHFDGVERILHAGDLSVLSVIRELESIAPVEAVQGNVEEEEVIRALPIKREIVVGHCRIGIVHIRGLRLVGTETRKRNQDKWAIEEGKGFSAIDFRGSGEDEEISTFLFLPAFVPALADQQALQKPLFCVSYF